MKTFTDNFIRLHGSTDALREAIEFISQRIISHPKTGNLRWGVLPKITDDTSSVEFLFSETTKTQHLNHFVQRLIVATTRWSSLEATILASNGGLHSNSELKSIKAGEVTYLVHFPCVLDSINSAMTLYQLMHSPTPASVTNGVKLLLSIPLEAPPKFCKVNVTKGFFTAFVISETIGYTPSLLDCTETQAALMDALPQLKSINSLIGLTGRNATRGIATLLALCEKAALHHSLAMPAKINQHKNYSL